MHRMLQLLIAFALAMSAGGCAFDVIHVEQEPAQLGPPAAGTKPFEITANVTLNIGHGYQRVLRTGTTWRCVGRLAQGDVYTSRDQVLTVEASNIQEAYLVVSSGRVVGFYMPVEKTFSPLAQEPELPFRTLP